MGSLGIPSPVRLAILETDTPVPGIQKKYKSYGNVFKYLFERACASLSPPQPLDSQLQLSFHDVVNDPTSYPRPDAIDAVLITGSKASAFESLDWIERLVQYTKLLLEGGRVRVIGVCFGHQIVGRALNAEVARNERGWELSVVEVDLTQEGKDLFGLEKLRIHQMHRDAVLEKPIGATNLAKTDICSTQALYIPKRMISVQGHPEFTGEMVREILGIRYEGNIIGKETYQDAIERVDNKHDGVAIAKAFLRFLHE